MQHIYQLEGYSGFLIQSLYTHQGNVPIVNYSISLECLRTQSKVMYWQLRTQMQTLQDSHEALNARNIILTIFTRAREVI